MPQLRTPRSLTVFSVCENAAVAGKVAANATERTKATRFI